MNGTEISKFELVDAAERIVLNEYISHGLKKHQTANRLRKCGAFCLVGGIAFVAGAFVGLVNSDNHQSNTLQPQPVQAQFNTIPPTTSPPYGYQPNPWDFGYNI